MRYADTAVHGAEDSLDAWLRPRLKTAEHVAMRTSFLTLPGLREIQPHLEDVLARGGQVDLVTGGEGEQADPEALAAAHQMVGASEGRFTVRVVTGGVFHNAKVAYVRHENGRAEARIGSANLTLGGLLTNHEAAVCLDSEVDDASVLDQVLAAVRAYEHSPAATLLDGELLAGLYASIPSRTAPDGKSLQGVTHAFGELLQPVMDEVDTIASRHAKETAGVPTGFADLDALTNGLHPGAVTVLASRPGVGRSTLALDFFRSVGVKQQIPAAFITAAATRHEVVQRILAAESRVRLGDMRGGRMTDDDWTRLARRMSELSDCPLHITSAPTLDLDALTAEITRLRIDNDVQFVVVDPLSAITATTEPGAPREREVAVTMRRLKALALDLDLPVVVTAELGRGPEQRSDKRPQLTDLRESDTIHQVADLLILLHRPDAYERDDPRMGEADLIVAKHRLGPCATITVAHQLHYYRFVDLAPE